MNGQRRIAAGTDPAIRPEDDSAWIEVGAPPQGLRPPQQDQREDEDRIATSFLEEPALDDEPSGGATLAIAMVVLAVLWLGFTAWAFLSAGNIGDIAPLLTTVAAGIAPLLLLVLIWLVMQNSPVDPVAELQDYARSLTREADASLQRLADAETRLTEAYTSFQRYTREATSVTESGAERFAATASRIEVQCSRVDEALNLTGERTAEALSRIAAFEEAGSRIDSRLSELARSLVHSSQELTRSSKAFEEQLGRASVAADDVQGRLEEAHSRTLSQVDLLRQNTHQAGDELAAMSEAATARVEIMLDRARTALGGMHEALEQQYAAIDDLTARGHAATEAIGGEAIGAFTRNMEEIEARSRAMNDALDAHGEKSSAIFESQTAAVIDLNRKLTGLEGTAEQNRQIIAGHLRTLTEAADGLDIALSRGHQTAGDLLQRAESLLLALDSNLREMEESLPSAFDRVDSRLKDTETGLRAVRTEVNGMADAAEGFIARLQGAGDAMTEQAADVERTLESGETRLARQSQKIAEMRADLEQVSSALAGLAEQTGPRTVEALREVRDRAAATTDEARSAIDAVIESAASRLGDASGAALEKAIADKVNTQLVQIAEIADNAVKSAHRATDHLMRQMMALTDSAAEMEGRIASAADAEETASRDFLTERSAQIIASLNNSAIDIAKWLDQDIGEREWAAYLNGDKSLFTRRAVRLLSGGQLKQVHARYQSDPDFQDLVNRYVAEFEGMLRDILAGRNGNSLAIAILSSDVGKLYVALAQAIERLRVA